MFLYSAHDARIETFYSEILTRILDAATSRSARREKDRRSDIEAIISMYQYILTKIAASYSTFYCLAVIKKDSINKATREPCDLMQSYIGRKLRNKGSARAIKFAVSNSQFRECYICGRTHMDIALTISRLSLSLSFAYVYAGILYNIYIYIDIYARRDSCTHD